jgi:hypothetical protein
MSEIPESWERNRADETDALVARVRAIIPTLGDRDVATKAIYEHVRKMCVEGARKEREGLVAMIRARAIAEEITADRWAQGGDDRMVGIHQKLVDVLRDVADRIEMVQ